MHCIEVSHLYQNEKWSVDQVKALELANSLSLKESTFRFCLMIDNYHVSQGEMPIVDMSIDTIVFEKDLGPLSIKALELIDPKMLKWEIFRKENKKVLFFYKDDYKIALKSKKNNEEKYLCTLLSLTWHLCRLRSIENPWFQEDVVKLTSILPRKYSKNEEAVRKILKTIDPNFPLEIIYC